MKPPGGYILVVRGKGKWCLLVSEGRCRRPVSKSILLPVMMVPERDALHVTDSLLLFLFLLLLKLLLVDLETGVVGVDHTLDERELLCCLCLSLLYCHFGEM